MPYRPRQVNLSANNLSTINILNTIRENASYEYQSQIPVVNKWVQVPVVGETILGNPTLTNQFVNALVNRIGMVIVRSALFYNPYSRLKKGFLYNGESVEDIFIDMAKVLDYSPEKGHEREHKRFLPDVHSSFHLVNWQVLYPLTIEYETLSKAFLSEDGMRDFFDKLINSLYRAYEYDEFLLFKYLIIKGLNSGKIGIEAIDPTNFKSQAGYLGGFQIC